MRLYYSNICTIYIWHITLLSYTGQGLLIMPPLPFCPFWYIRVHRNVPPLERRPPSVDGPVGGGTRGTTEGGSQKGSVLARKRILCNNVQSLAHPLGCPSPAIGPRWGWAACKAAITTDATACPLSPPNGGRLVKGKDESDTPLQARRARSLSARNAQLQGVL